MEQFLGDATAERLQHGAKLEDQEIDKLFQAFEAGSITPSEARVRVKRMLDRVRYIDPDTGLHSKTGFNAELTKAIETSVRLNSPLTLFVLDGKNFKDINDTLGHDVGDLIILAYAYAIGGSVRGNDIPTRITEEVTNQPSSNNGQNSIEARFGGDEYAIALQGADLNQSVAVWQRIESNIPLAVNFVIGNYDREHGTNFSARIAEYRRIKGEFTLNGGIAQLTPELDLDKDENGHYLFNGDRLFRRADQAMYIAKRTGGKNIGVSVHDPETQTFLVTTLKFTQH